MNDRERLTSTDESGHHHLRKVKQLGNDYASKKVLIQKLGDYENAEEKGELLRVPCNVGDIVYVIYKGYITSSKVLAFYYDRTGGMFDMQIKTKVETATGFEKVIDKDNYQFSDFGKTVFLTREEAEKALKGE